MDIWVDNKVYTQVPDQGKPKLLVYTGWIYTNKSSNGKQYCKARFVVRGFQDRDACNIWLHKGNRKELLIWKRVSQ